MPRTGSIAMSGNNFFNCNCLRRDEQPMGFERSISVVPSGSTSTSRGSSRLEKAASGKSSGTSIGISFREWTVKSTLSSRRA